jgi:hypothetical protein
MTKTTTPAARRAPRHPEPAGADRLHGILNRCAASQMRHLDWHLSITTTPAGQAFYKDRSEDLQQLYPAAVFRITDAAHARDVLMVALNEAHAITGEFTHLGEPDRAFCAQKLRALADYIEAGGTLPKVAPVLRECLRLPVTP